MKKLLILSALAALVGLTGCPSKDTTPETTTTVQAPATTVAPTTTMPPVGSDKSYCDKTGKIYSCEHPYYYNIDCGQGLDSNGHAGAAGQYTVYLRDDGDAALAAEKFGVYITVKMKNDTTKAFGKFTFANRCSEM